MMMAMMAITKNTDTFLFYPLFSLTHQVRSRKGKGTVEQQRTDVRQGVGCVMLVNKSVKTGPPLLEEIKCASFEYVS